MWVYLLCACVVCLLCGFGDKTKYVPMVEGFCYVAEVLCNELGNVVTSVCRRTDNVGPWEFLLQDDSNVLVWLDYEE